MDSHIEKNGYVYVHFPNHRYADLKGYIPLDRLIIETALNCALLPTTIVHHLNNDKTDSRLFNLAMTSLLDREIRHTVQYWYSEKEEKIEVVKELRMRKAKNLRLSLSDTLLTKKRMVDNELMKQQITCSKARFGKLNCNLCSDLEYCKLHFKC